MEKLEHKETYRLLQIGAAISPAHLAESLSPAFMDFRVVLVSSLRDLRHLYIFLSKCYQHRLHFFDFRSVVVDRVVK